MLKRFGLAAIATARELCPDVPVLADTKTVDGGQLEADMVFGAGAAFMTVLSVASRATHEAVGRRAEAFGATVVVDTLTESGKAALLPPERRSRRASPMWPCIRRRTRAWPANTSTRHIDAVQPDAPAGVQESRSPAASVRRRFDAVIAVDSGSWSSARRHHGKAAKSERGRSNGFARNYPDPGLGWPWDRK